MLRRVLQEQRRFVVLLSIAVAVNVGVYAAVVYPLSVRVADADTRAGLAESSKRDAEKEFAAAREVAASKDRAEADLRAFYTDVLPADLSAANRSTYLRVAQHARESNLRVLRRTASPTPVRGSSMDRLTIGLVLEGQYEDMRQFIHRLETSPQFVIIDDVAMDQTRESASSLTMTVQLSTYFKAAADAR